MANQKYGAGDVMMHARSTAATVLLAWVSLACMAPSMAINAVHWHEHMAGPMAWALSGGAVLSVLLAGVTPIGMQKTWRNREHGAFLACAALFLICLVFNLANAVAISSASRSETTGARASGKARLALLTGQLTKEEKSRDILEKVAGEQTASMVDGVLVAMRTDSRWTRSKSCTNATMDDSRSFCADYAQKLVARDAAAKVEELDKSIATLKGELLAATGPNVGQPDDPQAQSIVTALALIGLAAEPGKIGQGLNLWFAVAIEAIAALGPFALETILFGGARLASGAVPSVNLVDVTPRPAAVPSVETPALPAIDAPELRQVEAERVDTCPDPAQGLVALPPPSQPGPRRKLPPGVVELRPRDPELILREPDTAPGGEVRDFLRDFLADGPKAGADVKAEAEHRGFSMGALYRARDALKVDTSGKIGRSQAWALNGNRPGAANRTVRPSSNRTVRPSKGRTVEPDGSASKCPGSDSATN